MSDIFHCLRCRVLAYASGLVGGLCWHCRQRRHVPETYRKNDEMATHSNMIDRATAGTSGHT